MFWLIKQSYLSSSLISPCLCSPQSACANYGASWAGGNGWGPDPSSHWCLWPLLLTFGSYSKEEKKVPLLTLLHLCCTVVSVSPILTLRQYLPLEVSFWFLPTSFLCLSVCLPISFPIPFVSPLSPLLLMYSSLCLTALPCTPLSFFQTHCSQTLSSPHINPSLPSSVPHNSIPTGSYIFLHLDTACVT